MKNNEKREMTIDELQQKCDEAKKNFNVLNEQLEKAKQEEKERKQAELEQTKDARYKEIEELSEQLNTLIAAYINDYGTFSFTRSYSDNDHFVTLPYLRHLFF